MSLKMKMEMNGPQYKAKTRSERRQGSMNVNAALNSSTEAWHTGLIWKINDLVPHHFLPKDLIGEIISFRQMRQERLDVTSFHS